MHERRLDDLLSPDVVRHCEATPGFVIESIDRFKDFLRADTSIFPDDRQTFEHVLVDGDMAARFSFAGVLRIADGRIAQWWITTKLVCKVGSPTT
jgi:predicted ester cyclase